MTAAEALALAKVRWPLAALVSEAWWAREGAVEAWHVHAEDNTWLGNVEAFGEQGTWVLTQATSAPERWSPTITVKLDEIR